MDYRFRYIVKMINGKEYEIITNFHGEKDVLKYIDSHDYIELFDRKKEEMVAVKSEYVMSVLYKDSQKMDSEGNVDWADREDYLKEENERLRRELDIRDIIDFLNPDKEEEEFEQESKKVKTRNGELLQRTLRGHNYNVKGYITIPFSKSVKAIDEDEAEDMVYQYIEVEDGEFEKTKTKIEIDEIIEEDD